MANREHCYAHIRLARRNRPSEDLNLTICGAPMTYGDKNSAGVAPATRSDAVQYHECGTCARIFARRATEGV